MKKSFLDEIVAERDGEIDNSFSNFLRGYKKVQSIKEGLIDGVSLDQSLILFIEDNQQLRDSINSVKKSLFKHWRKGEYDTALAEKAWGRIVSESAKMYSTEIGKEPRLWDNLFSDVVLATVTEQLEREFYTNLKKGKINMEELFNE